MLNRLMQVVRVFTTRPWVWLMTMVALFQVPPAWIMTRGGTGQSTVSVLPEVAPREPVVRTSDDFLDLAERGELAMAQSVDLSERRLFPTGPFRVSRDAAGARTIELSASPPGAVAPVPSGSPFDELGILNHLRDVTDLSADHLMFSSDAIERLGKLQHLESLSLRYAGSRDSSALRELEAELPRTLGRLTSLKRLDLKHAFGMAARVPPLPNLEFLSIGPTLHLEESLRTVAEHSPRLSTLVLIGYPQESLTPGERDALRKMPNLRVIYVEGFSDTGATRAALRADLPGVWLPRSVYHPRRVYGALYLALGAIFPHMILWMQSLVCFSLVSAQILPGFRGAHLGVPFAAGLVVMTALTGVALWAGIAPLPALLILLTGAGITMNPQPLVDLTPLGTGILRALVAWRIAVLGLMFLLVFRGQPTLDAMLLGEFPGITLALLAVELAAWCWTIPRLVRQARVLAEIGQPLIPGMVYIDQLSMQPVAYLSQKADRSNREDNWPDRLLERLLSGPRRSLSTLLRGGNAGVVWHVRVIVFIFLLVTISLTFRPHLSGSLSEQIARALPLAGVQAGVLFIGWVFMRWIGRRQVISHEILRPVSRDEYYRGLWKAISSDLCQVLAYLFAIGAAALIVRRMGPIPWMGLIAATGGLFLLLHGYLLWLLTARQLWVPLVTGFAVLTIVFPVVSGVVAYVVSTVGPPGGKESSPVFIAVPLIGIVLGAALQVWQRRRWNTLEFG